MSKLCGVENVVSAEDDIPKSFPDIYATLDCAIIFVLAPEFTTISAPDVHPGGLEAFYFFF
jgi:hypothetical protein